MTTNHLKIRRSDTQLHILVHRECHLIQDSYGAHWWILAINRISSPQWDLVTVACQSHGQINSVSGNWLNNALASCILSSQRGGHSHRRDLITSLIMLMTCCFCLEWEHVTIVRNVLEKKVDSYLTTKHMNNLATILCTLNVRQILCSSSSYFCAGQRLTPHNRTLAT